MIPKWHRFIPVGEPVLAGNEKKYVQDCMDTAWISSAGIYVDRFEHALMEACQSPYAVACCNGTAALHLAMLALRIGPGDEVIVPTLTFIATANAVRYTGATPVFVDCDPETWLIDLNAAEAAITEKTRAILPVDLYGHPADMDEVRALARRHGLYVVEDSAESLGALYKGAPVGNLADITTFSFFGNKTVTTGEGGAVTTADPDLAARMRLLRGQGQDPQRRYWFIELGYNYRMTNIQAAIGLAQMETLDWQLAQRRSLAAYYRSVIHERLPDWQPQVEQAWAKSSYWLNAFVIPERFPLNRDELIVALAEHNIETRPVFYPMHVLPVYCDHVRYACPVAEDIAARGINLPTSAKLSHQEVDYIVEVLHFLSTHPKG